MMKSVSVKAYAKVNLSLDVLEKMDTGYHRIETVMQQINIADYITIESDGVAGLYTGYHIKLNSNGANLPENQEDNLAYKAAKIMAETFCPFKDNRLTIKLEKNIPTAAGLAGGSSDAAAVMLALCKLWDISIELKDLCEIATKLGADVPFCLIGNAKNNPHLGFAGDELASSAALAEGIGEKLTPTPGIVGWLVIAKPSIMVSTPFVYEKLTEYNALPEQGGNFERSNTKELMTGLQNNNKEQILKNMLNILETVTLKEYPIVVYTKNKIAEISTSEKILMSGSGPTVFAFFLNEKDAIECFAKATATFQSKSGHDYDVRLAQML